MKKYRFLKLIGLAILTMVTLVIISVIEVTIYSYLINPGQEMPVYDAHAEMSAPWISGIFGFLVFFFVVRYWCKKRIEDVFRLFLFFILTYVVLDLILISSFGVNWADFYTIFLVANGAKFLGGLTAYYFFRHRITADMT